MSGFSFPPPPPPPPKPHPVNERQGAPQRGGRGQDRGRGPRGSFEQRGRGQSGGRGGQSHHRQGPYHSGTSNSFPGQSPSNSGYGVPSHENHERTHSEFHGSLTSNGQHPAGSPPRTTAGHKRKLDALRGPTPKKPDQKPAPATAPAIPTFGVPFLPSPLEAPKTRRSVSSNEPGQPKQKPLTRGLGLTPSTGEPQYSSSEDEDDEKEVDEEAMYAELGDKLTFEHNGVVMALSSQADILAWKQDRRKNWPTKSRMATKDEERRRVGAERKRLLAGVDQLYGRTSRFSKPGSNIWSHADAAGEDVQTLAQKATPDAEAQQPETDLERAKREISEKTNRLDELRKKVTESEARNRAARERAEQRQNQQDDESASLPLQDGKPEPPATSAAHEAGAVQDAEDGSAPGDIPNGSAPLELSPEIDPSSSSGDSETDDGPPEESTSKAPVDCSAFAKPTAPVCRYFGVSGWCRDGDACTFRHEAHKPSQEAPLPSQFQQYQATRPQGHVRKDERPPRLEQTTEKKTIFQRLMEQEEGEDDRLALKVVKYLGEAGFFR